MVGATQCFLQSRRIFDNLRAWPSFRGTVMAVQASRISRLRRSLTGREWLRLSGFYSIIAILHMVGFGVLILFVVPSNFKGLGIGVGLTAYGFGLRHAFDADHISAIDNTTRKLLADGKRPLGVGFFFSLGHSTIVVALSVALTFAAKAVAGQIGDSSNLLKVGGYIGTGVSAFFLYLIAAINLVILVGIIRIFREMRQGKYDEPTLEEKLNQRGLMNRLLGPLARSIKSQLADVPGRGPLRSRVRHRHRGGPSWPSPRAPRPGAALVRHPQPAHPLRRGHVADGHDRRRLHERRLRLGLLEAGPQGLLQPHDHRAVGRGGADHRDHRGPLDLRSPTSTSRAVSGTSSGINLNAIGFIIVGMFVVTWVAALAIWRLGRIEQRWALSPAAAEGSAELGANASARDRLETGSR